MENDLDLERAGETTVHRRVSLPPPQPFDGKAELWPRWRQRFSRFRQCTGLHLKTQSEQVSALLYSMGEVADDILTTLSAIDEGTATYAEVIEAFDNHFNARKNIIFARAKFNKRVQQPGESVDTFIQDVHRLADDCSYGAVKDELIRDRIVVGVADDELSKQMQLKLDLTLREAVQLSRQAEARDESQTLLRPRVEQVAAKSKFMHHTQRPSYRSSAPSHSQKPCGYCGRTPSHKRDACPAKSAVCSSCGKRGHYKAVCRSQPRVREVEVHDSSQSTSFLGTISINEVNSDEWSAVLKMNTKPTKFKLDTGAAVSVIGDKGVDARQPLSTSDKILRGPGGTTLSTLGTFEATLQYKDRRVKETIYVIKGQTQALLSKSACVKLGLIARLDAVESRTPDFKGEFPKLFSGLGVLRDHYTIKLREGAEPMCLYTPRKVAHPLIPKVRAEIDRMQEQGVISPITEPTEWCSGMVVVPKSNGTVRICVDLTALNKAVLREIHPLQSVDEQLAKLSGSQVFTKLDATSGFWQIPLNPDSRKYTTFITPFGRFCFNRLPFGISSAPEIFQRKMSMILQDLPGVICHIDDILIHAPDQDSHNKRVRNVLCRLQEAGVTLNDKCEFSKSSVRFLGHIINGSGITVDPSKVEAIKKFPQPQNITELQRFLGMVNQMAKFTPNLATATEPLRALLKKESAWAWGPPQDTAFQRTKEGLITTPVLAHYSPERETIIAADASASGLGAVLMQIQDDGTRRPVSYISRALTDAEKNYAVIEKEALAATWASERFSEYILGKQYTLETDHKPLVPLLSTKDLHKMPPRIQRFRLRLMRFSPEVIHVSGKQQITADALSRAPTNLPSEADTHFISEVAEFAQQAVDSLPATSQRIVSIIALQKDDPETAEIRKYCLRGWPAYMPENPLLKQYWSNRHHFTIVDDILLFDDRIVIPRVLRLDILSRLHEGHLGITKCRALAQTSVWWPNISSQIEEMVRKCGTCAKLRPIQREPLLPSSLPERPWSRLAMDLFDLKGRTYIVVVDYYSRWVELRLLEQLDSKCVINKLKSIFATHGIPETIVSDNGPQFASAAFQAFAREYGFTHTTSSPRYPQSNGEAERAVQTVKQLLKKAKDPYIALLYRATPLQNE